MAAETTYTGLRQHLSAFLDRAVEDPETVVVRRRSAKDVARIAADELAGLQETSRET
jgi:PHD/YefM family antitoxin component YafN of YafNO toxin-antitoxin module